MGRKVDRVEADGCIAQLSELNMTIVGILIVIILILLAVYLFRRVF
jgi:flagellar biogenesis protein FliO